MGLGKNFEKLVTFKRGIVTPAIDPRVLPRGRGPGNVGLGKSYKKKLATFKRVITTPANDVRPRSWNRGTLTKKKPLSSVRARAEDERGRHETRRNVDWTPCRRAEADVSVYSGQIYQSTGLVSIDRSEAAALLSTTP